jgi:hypothetical protein
MMIIFLAFPCLIKQEYIIINLYFIEKLDENKQEYMRLNAEKYLSFSLFNKTRIYLSKYIILRIIG